jgi:hypothetical protein
MKSKTTQKIKFFFLASLAFLITGSSAIAQCEMGNYPGLNNSSSNLWVTNYFLGTSFSASTSGTLTGIGYKGTGSGGACRLAVYSDVGGNPGALVAYTNTFTVGAGQIVVPVVTNTVIPAGVYWIVYNQGNTSHHFTDNPVVTPNYKYFAYSFNSVPPNSTSWSNYAGGAHQEDFYLKYICQASALNFDGVDDHVNFGTSINSVLDPLNKITVEAWVKPSTTNGLGVIAGNYATPSNQMQFLLRRDGDQYAFWVDDGGGYKVVNSGPSTVLTGVWQHVAGVWDGSQLLIYIDGVLNSTTTGVTGPSFASCSNYMSLGYNNMNENFAGTIDETRIWTTARTQCEINRYRNCEISGSATGLLANYHFNQGLEFTNNSAVNTLIDASGNSYNGTLGNFALTGTTSNWVSPGGVVSGNVSPAPSPVISVNDGVICAGQSFTIVPGGALTYTYSGGSNVVFPTSNASYSVIGTAANGCESSSVVSSVTVNICAPASALSLDGNNDYISVPDQANLNFGTGDFTIEANFKSSVSQSAYAGIVAKAGNGANIGFQLVLVNDRIAAEFSDGSTGFGIGQGLQGTTILTDGNWHHMAMIVNRSLSQVQLLVDGNIEATVTNAAITTLNVDDPSSLLIGVERTNGAYINGNLDEVRIWNTARTLCELNTYKACEIPNANLGLIANYHFNQGFDAAANPTEMNLTDASGNSNTGTLHNFALSATTSNWIASGAVINGYTTTLVPPVVTVNSGPICAGQSFTMVPTGAITYTFSSGTDVVAPIADATYTVTGTDANGCENMAISSVTVHALPILTVNSHAICAGQSFTMIPSGADTYTYSSGTNVVMPTADATYSVSGTDVNGCVSGVDAISSVTVNILPIISVNSGTVCVGQSFTMIPSGADTYTYSSGTNVVMPTVDATYSVSGTDANGCVSSIDAVSSVTVNALPIIAVNSGTICAGQSFTMAPTGANTYTYSSGTDVVMPTADATYSVAGTDANGCVSGVDAISSVTVNVLPILMTTTNNTLLCTGQTATLSVTGAISYTWSTTETTADIAVTPTTQTTYTVDGLDANGCMNSTTIMQDVSLCTGITQLSNPSSILLTIYPNPNNGAFTIKSDMDLILNITNELGQVLQVIHLDGANNRQTKVDVLASGIYFVIGQNENQSVRQKIIVSK